MTKNLQFGYYKTSELNSVYKFKNIGKNVHISKSANIVGSENISLGNNIRIDNFTNIICKNGYINIGDYCHIGSGCFILGTGGIDISDYCGFAMGVQILSSSDNYDGSTLTNPTVGIEITKPNTKKITFSNHNIIGANSIILPGAELGEGVSVGALSLIKTSQKLLDWHVYFGIPVKVISKRKKDLLVAAKKFKKSQK